MLAIINLNRSNPVPAAYAALPQQPRGPPHGDLVLVEGEPALTLDDVLSRRTRALFLNARAAIDMAPAVAKLMAEELGAKQDWIDHQLLQFDDLARKYLLP